MPRVSTRALLATLLLSASVPLSVGLAQPPGSAPVPPPTTLDFASDGKTWVWLRGNAQGATLFRSAPGQPGVEVGRGKWSEALPMGNDCWVLSKAGTLDRIPLAGGSPTTVLRNLSHPGGLASQGDALYWLELSGESRASFFVPTSGPRLQLRTRTGSGETRTVGEWPGGVSPRCLPGDGDVIGVTGTGVFVRVRRAAGTEFVRFPLPSGDPERIGSEAGEQTAVLHGETFYWTAASEEAPARARMVRRRTGGAVENLTDWLPGSGNLVASSEGVWYAATRQLYRLPDRFGASRVTRPLSMGHVAADGARLVEVTLDGTPRVLAEAP